MPGGERLPGRAHFYPSADAAAALGTSQPWFSPGRKDSAFQLGVREV